MSKPDFNPRGFRCWNAMHSSTKIIPKVTKHQRASLYVTNGLCHWALFFSFSIMSSSAHVKLFLVQSDAGNNKDWDDSILTKEEKDTRIRRKEEAVRNKERAMEFLRSHQVLLLYTKQLNVSLHATCPSFISSHQFKFYLEHFPSHPSRLTRR